MKKSVMMLLALSSVLAVPAFAGDAMPTMDGLKKDVKAAKAKTNKEAEALKKDGNGAKKKVEEKTK